MSKKNAVEKSQFINEKYREYLKSFFKIGNEKLQSLFENQLEKEQLFKGPYVDLNLPFQRGKTINQLIDEGIVAKSFDTINVDLDRPLYAHQETAIRNVCSGRNAIITTGTGSGKTESFLYPVINEILLDIENGNTESGVRAIFLYPLNALVNDQIDRLRNMLKKCPDVTYGFFTGDTAETMTAKQREEYAKENGGEIPANEIITRKEIRSNPPHLLFTNYSMLEYLLIRPSDYSLFEREMLKNWKFVILDEAHSYSGSLGIEISLLLRRLTGFAEKKPRFILTSATLGEKGKSESKIIDFAEKLTSSKYDVKDIIFSKRIALESDCQYRITGEELEHIKGCVDDNRSIKFICDKYKIDSADDVKGQLFDLLVHDANVYRIYSLLVNGCKDIKVLENDLSEKLTLKQLLILVDLVNMAEKNGIGLFDLKYHSFVRTLSGAYITCGENQVVSLSKANSIGGMKAFEIGNCRYCSSAYIIGRLKHNQEENMDFLLQNTEVDIYENYGENSQVKLDYFLMDNAINDDEIAADILEEYAVCSVCGAAYDAENINAKKCNCGKKHEFIVYRVKQSKNKDVGESYNNINQCPCCGHKTRSGVVKSMNLGKDLGTALIAQLLYEAIDENDSVAEMARPKLSLSLSNKTVEMNDKKKTKQFLTFSDSRQQASFSAVYFDAQHVRTLQKRLVWKMIENHNYESINVNLLATKLEDYIKKYEVFSNGLVPHKNAWAAIMVDLLKIDGTYDTEAMGLYYFDLDLTDILSHFNDEVVEAELGSYNIKSLAELETLMQVVLASFKTVPAINYVDSQLSIDEKRDFLEYRSFDNYVMLQSVKRGKDTRSFLPVTNKDNAIVRFVMKVCECDDKKAKDLLKIIFDLCVDISSMTDTNKVFIKRGDKDSYQINVNRYIVKNYKKEKYYKCTKCGRLTPYNLHEVCPQDKCKGTLVVVNPDVELKDNFYRNQYMNKRIEKIVIEEHTAQLDKKKAKEYQNKFKTKEINILSCSTTFEMGIDLGSLETVYMRNVPPTPANYVQRAGRAGRSKESTSYVLTYCGTGSHDYTYFEFPEKMIQGIIQPPYFDVVNRKIIIRHLMSACLGFFFRDNPGLFDKIEEMAFNGADKLFYKYLKSNPALLNEYINKKMLPEEQYSAYHDLKWFYEMGEIDEKLQHFVDTMMRLRKEFEDAIEHAVKEDNYTEAAYLKRQIDGLHNQKVIEALSRYCVIPKYGFPVDSVELEIYDNGALNTKYDLNRDLKIAISEYAPDSEIIVDKNKYVSQYISLPKTKDLTKNYFRYCKKCRKANVFVSSDNAMCRYCGNPMDGTVADYYVEPTEGFKTGVTKESKNIRPKRTYAGEVIYIGNGLSDNNKVSFGNVISVETTYDDELLVMNRTAFYMCRLCGYSEKIDSKNKLSTAVREHKNYRQYSCPCEDLEKVYLGHRFRTDIARINIPMLSLEQQDGQSIALSFMYAFLEGVSSALNIERSDIQGIVEVNKTTDSYDVLIYDNVPGGAGHVKRLLDIDAVRDSLKEAQRKVNQHCCDEDTSCYNCLRNYHNQMYHERLRRNYAMTNIVMLLKAI